MREEICYRLEWTSVNVPHENLFEEFHTLKTAKDNANRLATAGNKNISLYEVRKSFNIIPTSDWFDKSIGPRG
jgi:hypothetical protein